MTSSNGVTLPSVISKLCSALYIYIAYVAQSPSAGFYFAWVPPHSSSVYFGACSEITPSSTGLVLYQVPGLPPSNHLLNHLITCQVSGLPPS